MKKLSKKMLAAVAATACLSSFVFAKDEGKFISALPAFPGAEGGGKYTTGGRGLSVYHVTNLLDYKSSEEPIEGSFRKGFMEGNHMIVFDVSGTINLVEAIRTGQIKNVTVAGQTAPGDGITLAGFETNISKAENLIIRYVRFRPGSKNVHEGDGMDGLWGRQQKNVIIDHCSFGFSTDEGLSTYRGENMTVQWCIISESLTMSGHTKGRHGYGGIWGGVNTTFHHNLLASHTSRNPRIGGGTPEKDDNDHLALLQLSNNVIYNWGFNTCYGGGRSNTNFINNYEKAGPGTREDVAQRIIDFGEGKKVASLYLDGNFIDTSKANSKDNSKGLFIGEAAKPTTTIVDKPFEMEGTRKENLKVEKAQKCYKSVLAQSGATLPRRDAIDARIVYETKSGTGRYINTDHEVGGYPCLVSETRAADWDSDGDGMPDFWEKKNGFNPADSSDGALIAKNGYSNLENYLNSLVPNNYSPENPEVVITGVKNNDYATLGEKTDLSFSIKSKKKIAKIELYDGSELLEEKKIGAKLSKANFDFVPKKTGTHFVSVRVTDENGNAMQSSAVQLHALPKNAELDGYTCVQIGKPGVPGVAWTEKSDSGDVLTVMGSGKLGEREGAFPDDRAELALNDDCQFAYKKFSGDFVFSAKIETVAPVDNHAFSGIMVRSSLEADSADVCLGLSWVKSTSYNVDGQKVYRDPWSIYLCGRKTNGGKMDPLTECLDGKDTAKEAGFDLQDSVHFKNFDQPLGYFIRLERSGKTFSAFCSSDGNDWQKIGERETELGDEVFLGFAVDGNKVANKIDNLNTAVFSNISLEKK
nr:hypothetical protein [Treponema sp.]